MRIAHLTASTFFGGPERQMLGLAQSLAVAQVESVFLSFSEKSRCRSFLGRVCHAGFEGDRGCRTTIHPGCGPGRAI